MSSISSRTSSGATGNLRRARWLRRLLPLTRHPRSSVLTTCAVALLGVLCFSLLASEGPAARTIAFAAVVVGFACLADNVFNLLARHEADEARLRTIETAWLETHIELALLRRRAREQGVDVETQHLATEELQRQLSLPSPPAGEDGAATA